MGSWEVKFTDEFNHWFQEDLTEGERAAVLSSIMLIRSRGPSLGRPDADTVRGSRHSNMKELRTQYRGNPYRTFFVFDPLRRAVLLIGGNKRGDKRFYTRMIALADTIYDRHLRTLAPKGK